ncbi:MAG: hypothetical protein A3J29_07715 [Acidobacteria bacterium RIFCSPLOWO2_12_FULL_67_14b]|nr:MAG: hypothetical protein A3J29_07715 [Acidobacteria bacterium RIFCSPLOWO2_12_FULL_67_14b]
MTIDTGVASRLQGRSLAWRLGASTTAAIFVVLMAWALSVDFVKASSGGFFGDGATYYSLAHSLSGDFDFEYRREDLVRVWKEFPGGPQGLFLKRGRELKLFYAKSYIYPLFAAPLVWLFGTNGFLVLHGVLMAGCFLCAYAFLSARSHPVAALIFAAAFLFVSVAPVYMVQIAPDFFNFAIVLFAFFFWCYKEVAGPSPLASDRSLRTRWLLSPRSDIVAAVFLGIATFSKPTHVMLIAPLLASALLRRQWQRALVIGGVFGAVTAALFALNIAITGEWNYQGGDRKTFYSTEGGGFPYQSEAQSFDTVGLDRTTNAVQLEVLTSRDAVFEVFRHNLAYFFIGRHTGFAVYFFPGMMAVFLFLLATRDRAVWQWLTLAAGLGSAVVLLLYMPFTYSGGGGPVGNRYFLGTYGLFLFLVPPLQTAVPGLAAMAISALFVAPILSNPFYASTHPSEHSKTGLFRRLPTELTMVNDLPVNVTPSRTRQPLSGSPPVFAYFLDDSVFNREGEAFWVRGESTADILLRAPIAIETKEAVSPRQSLRIEKLTVDLETGPKANRVIVTSGADRRVVEMAPGSRQSFELFMPPGVPYRPDPRFPTNYVYMVTITSGSGFVPMFEAGSPDSRFLGVMVRLVPHYEGQP